MDYQKYKRKWSVLDEWKIKESKYKVKREEKDTKKTEFEAEKSL